MNTVYLTGLINEIRQSEEREKAEQRLNELKVLYQEKTNQIEMDLIKLEMNSLREKIKQLDIQDSQRAEKASRKFS